MDFLLDRSRESAEIINSSLSLMKTLTKKLEIILSLSIILLSIGGWGCYALEFQVASLTEPALPANRIQPEERTYPVESALSHLKGGIEGQGVKEMDAGSGSKAVTPPDSSQAVPYDDGITWSWEEKVKPIDILDYVKKLPYNKWVEIDEKTTRQLFEGIVQKALKQMQIEGNGGEFEKVLRQKLLYFTPEYEYYYPPYEEDFSKRIVRFPIKIMRKKDNFFADEIIYFKLGRPEDDEREIQIGLNSEEGKELIKFIHLWRKRYVVGETGRPKTEIFHLNWMSNYKEVSLFRNYYNADGSVFKEDEEPSLSFQQGNPTAVEDNTTSEPPLDLSGVDILFEPAVFDAAYENWGSYQASYFQCVRSIINLCKLQLGLIDNGQELEKILRREFLEYVPWKPIDPNNHNAWKEPFFESVDIRRESTPEPDKTVVYHFDIGEMFARDIYVTFTRELGANIPYDWGIKQISFIQPVTMKYKDKDGVVKQGVGELTKLFLFDYTQDYLTGRNPTEIVATYEKYLSDPRGYTLTPYSKQLVAYFKYGEPSAHMVALK